MQTHRLLRQFAALALSISSFATSMVERPDLGSHFDTAKVTGTFVLYDLSADRITTYNPKRAETRYLPASTFKIFNSLAGIDSGAVRDVDEVLPYGGKPQWNPKWEHDMSLRDAIRISNVPIYQELARRIGLSKMQGYLAAVGYGNSETGQVADRFWLDGPLAISALEEARFTARLAEAKLPFSPRAMAQTREIMQLEQTPQYRLFAKTGTTGSSTKPSIGWWVGWVERGDQKYAFALNIDINDDKDYAQRIAVAKQCLTALGVL